MAERCYVCGGRGKFTVVLSSWEEPKQSPPYYNVSVRENELICKCCEGKGGMCGCI